jgi:hypothetical protein
VVALLAALLSALPLVAEGAGWYAPPAGSRLGVALLVWLALAGLPGRRGGTAAGAVAGVVALASPVLALAAVLDGAQGAQDRLPAAALGLACAALLAPGARRGGGRAVHGVLWLVLVPGLPLLHAALTWASAPGGGAAPGVLPFALSPLEWAHGLAREGGRAPLSASWTLPLLAALVLLVVPRGASAAEEEA